MVVSDLVAINVIQHEGKTKEVHTEIRLSLKRSTFSLLETFFFFNSLLFSIIFFRDQTTHVAQNYGVQYDTSALRSSGSVIRDERFGNEILARAGPSHQYQHPQYRTQESTVEKFRFRFSSQLII